jgi:hypothetical protein
MVVLLNGCKMIPSIPRGGDGEVDDDGLAGPVGVWEDEFIDAQPFRTAHASRYCGMLGVASTCE